MKIEVVYSVWGAGEQVFNGGVQEVEAPSDELLRAIAGAESSGIVRVLSASPEEQAKMGAHVQSQEDGEAAYDAAQADGSWRDGNLRQYVLDAAARLDSGVLSDADRARQLEGLVAAYTELGDAAAASLALDSYQALVAPKGVA